MNKRGNILLPIISAVAVFALVAAGYFFWQSQQPRGSALGPYTPSPTANNPAPVPTTQDEMANWKTFVSNENQFSIKYPANWYIGQSNSDLWVNSEPIPTDALTRGHDRSLQISTVPATSDSLAPPYERSWKQEITKTTLDRIEAIKIVDLEPNYGSGTKETLIVATKNGKRYAVIYENNDNGTYNPVFDQILSTFKIVNIGNEVVTQPVRGDLYPQPTTWRTVDLLTPDLTVCLPPKWKPEPEGSGHIVFDRDPAYRPDVAWIARLPYFGGSRREEYINLKTQYEPDLKSKVSVKELTINSRSILDISIYSMPEALVFADNGNLIEIQLASWNLVNDSRSAFLKDIYTMVGCIK